MRFLSPILTLLIAFALVAGLSFTPAAAQDAAKPTTDSREAQLREWFNALPKHRQEELKQRLKTLKRLPKERREEMLQAAKEGRPILSDEQRKNLQKLRKLSYLERIRLYTTAAEIDALRRGPRAREFEQAMKLEGPERMRELRGMMFEQRQMMFVRSLPADKRREIMNLPENERRQAVRKLFEEEGRTRLQQLEGFYPRLAELKEAAQGGDKEARKSLRQMYADLRTLDLLIQRLAPEKREQIMTELRDLSMEDAANAVRKALQDQWQAERKGRNPGRRNNDRGTVQPERNAHRAPDQRRKPREQ
ncbi:MAG: hypothetical protein KDB68_14415 [Planctomycetes bacterium]|nr:hypothetical protein [Planctomycetota bacterium]